MKTEVSLESVKRIIDAVDPKFVPDTLNVDALRDDLNGGVRMYEWLCRSPAEYRSQKEKADQIVHHAQELLSNLQTTGDQWLDVIVGAALGRYRTDAEGRIGSIDPNAQPYTGTIKALEWLVESLPRPPGERGGSGSSLHLYITVALANHYRKHFKREPGCSRPHDGGSVGGPFVRFAEAVCDEAGTKVTPETIVTYLKRQKRMGTKAV